MWLYNQPTRICFGLGCREKLSDIVGQLGKRPVLVSDRGLQRLDSVTELVRLIVGDL